MKTKKKRVSKDVYVLFALVLALCVGLIAVRVHNEKSELPVEQATPRRRMVTKTHNCRLKVRHLKMEAYQKPTLMWK